MDALTNVNAQMRPHRSPAHMLADLDKTQPSCVISEILLPEIAGLDLQAVLLRDFPATAILFVTQACDLATAVQAMKQGAVDFLEKPVNTLTLLRSFNEARAMALAWHKTEHERKAVARCADELVDRERQMLPYLARGASNKEIVSELRLASRTVEHYRRTIFEKMRVESVLELARKWVLLCSRTPRCLELTHRYLELPHPISKCANPACTAAGTIIQSPTSASEQWRAAAE